MNYFKTCLREQSSGETCQPPIYEEQEHIKRQLYSYVKYVKICILHGPLIEVA